MQPQTLSSVLPHTMSGNEKFINTTQASSSSQVIIPYETDERCSEFKLDGRATAGGAIFVGWTNNVLKSFVGSNPKLAIQSLPFNDIGKIFGAAFDWNPDLKQFVRKSDGIPAFKLAQLCVQVEGRGTSYQLSAPTFVRVLAKQCLITIPKQKDTVLIIGKLIIGDSTGCCAALMYNDPVDNIYNQVEVGDSLVISAALVQKSKALSPENVFFLPNKWLHIELKFRMFESKRVYRVEQDPRRRILEGFVPEKGTWLPSQLWNESAQHFEFPPNSCGIINVCGVVSYVGSVLRFRVRSQVSQTASSFYHCFRWIQVVDWKQPKPLSIQIFLNTLNWKEQENLVPGTSAVFTNLRHDEKSDFLDFHLQSTSYTNVHINHDIAHIYLSPLPRKERDTIRDAVSRSRCSKTLQRKDVEWSVGGTLFLPVVNPGKCILFYEQLKKEDPSISDPYMAPMKDLVRRETQRLYVHGFMYKVIKVSRGYDHKIRQEVYWMANEFPRCEVDTTQEIDTFLPDYEKYWFSFPRKLLNIVDVPCDAATGDLFEVFENNRIQHKDLCSPLLLPAKYPENDQPFLKSLPIVGGDTYFVISIADPVKKCLYTCMWKSFPVHVMEQKLNEAILLPVRKMNKTLHQENAWDKEKENVVPLDPKKTSEKSANTCIFILEVLKIEDKDLSSGDEHLQVSLVDFVHSVDADSKKTSENVAKLQP